MEEPTAQQSPAVAQVTAESWLLVLPEGPELETMLQELDVTGGELVAGGVGVGAVVAVGPDDAEAGTGV
jgi:hypothetical protein